MKEKSNMSFESPSFWERIDEILVRFPIRFNYIKYTNSLKLKGNEVVLELGCGAGNLSRFIAQKLSKKGFLTCIEVSDYWLSEAKNRMERFDNIEFKLGNITELNLKNSYYDAVILHYVLHDIGYNQRLKTIKLLKGKLKDEGKIYIREPTRKNHGMPAEEIENLMYSAGLKEISSKQVYYSLLRSHYIGIFQKFNY